MFTIINNRILYINNYIYYQIFCKIIQKLNGNPLSYDLHVQYIEKLKEMGKFEELRAARNNMKNIYPLSESKKLKKNNFIPNL